jgi:hypothetical protein
LDIFNIYFHSESSEKSRKREESREASESREKYSKKDDYKDDDLGDKKDRKYYKVCNNIPY